MVVMRYNYCLQFLRAVPPHLQYENLAYTGIMSNVNAFEYAATHFQEDKVAVTLTVRNDSQFLYCPHKIFTDKEVITESLINTDTMDDKIAALPFAAQLLKTEVLKKKY